MKTKVERQHKRVGEMWALESNHPGFKTNPSNVVASLPLMVSEALSFRFFICRMGVAASVSESAQ